MKLTGVEATISTFRTIDKRMTDAAAKQVEKGAKDIAALARRLVPYQTGALQATIRATRIKTDYATRWRVLAGGNSGGVDTTEYADYVERGESSNRSKWSLSKYSKAKAEATGYPVGPHYMRRAYDFYSQTVQDNIKSALKNELRVISLSTRSLKS